MAQASEESSAAKESARMASPLFTTSRRPASSSTALPPCSHLPTSETQSSPSSPAETSSPPPRNLRQCAGSECASAWQKASRPEPSSRPRIQDPAAQAQSRSLASTATAKTGESVSVCSVRCAPPPLTLRSQSCTVPSSPQETRHSLEVDKKLRSSAARPAWGPSKLRTFCSPATSSTSSAPLLLAGPATEVAIRRGSAPPSQAAATMYAPWPGHRYLAKGR
mmetsp:Transcript_126773/g.370562  ORF Transcript_126773/g.370562 Transcript_126773/m.370562 type:complete len:222 (+) Transcript_126773:378-1043(+)